MDIDPDAITQELKSEMNTPSFEIKGYMYNLIRTTQRNYINLTSIADNKANILISINSLMLTILIPIILTNLQIITDMKMYIPIGGLAFTCLVTIIISALVLTPFKGDYKANKNPVESGDKSPFFFTNVSDLSLDQFTDQFERLINDKELTSKLVVADLYNFGKVLEHKYDQIKTAYKVFNLGLLISFLLFIVMFFV